MLVTTIEIWWSVLFMSGRSWKKVVLVTTVEMVVDSALCVEWDHLEHMAEWN
jgi:hypothetical protein